MWRLRATPSSDTRRIVVLVGRSFRFPGVERFLPVVNVTTTDAEISQLSGNTTCPDESLSFVPVRSERAAVCHILC